MGKLTFKGDGPVKKKKKKSHSHRNNEKSTQQDQDDEIDGWIPVPEQALMLGPSYLTLKSSSLLSSTVCLAIQPTTNKIYGHPIPHPSATAAADSSSSNRPAITDMLPEESEGATIVQAEPEAQGPSDVHHVWVCTRIVDSDDKVTLRAATGRFLAADQSGILSCDREARGPLEEWTLHDVPPTPETAYRAGFALQSSYGQYLSADVVAGGRVDMRADSESIGEHEVFTIYMQGEYLSKAKKALFERKGVKAATKHADTGLTVITDVAGAARDTISKYQRAGTQSFNGSADDIRDLKRARKEGRLAEALLDKRAKMKSDRYC